MQLHFYRADSLLNNINASQRQRKCETAIPKFGPLYYFISGESLVKMPMMQQLISDLNLHMCWQIERTVGIIIVDRACYKVIR